MEPQHDLTISLLGPLDVRRDGVPVAVPAGRQRVLLASLALAAGRSVDVSTLADHLWGEALPDHPRAALQNVVLRLRRLLGTASIQTDTSGYRLNVEAGQVDALLAEELIERAIAEDAARARELLAKATALWRGTALGGIDSDQLVRRHAARLSELQLVAEERLIDLDLRTGASESWVARLRELTRMYPLRESLWERLLASLLGAGRRAEALAAYDEAREVLVDSLGTEPSSGLQALHRRLLEEDEAGPPTRTDRAPAEVPRQLPAAPAEFIGRQPELASLDGVHPTATTVVLHGPGGVGKTALGLRWAHESAPRHPDGQVYLDLRGFGPDEPVRPGAALAMMLRAIGVPDRRLPPTTAERAALWRGRTAGRSLLVFLDNAHDAEQLRPLLPAPPCSVVVTSRNALRGLAIRDRAVRLAVESLSDQDSLALVAQVLGSEAVSAEQEAAGELVRLCGRLPLALLIGAQVAAENEDPPIATTVSQLRSHRLDVLSDAADPAADLREIIARSYQSLDAEAARAFRVLGLHPAPVVETPVAAALLDLPEPAARRLLDRLVSVHLLQRHDPGHYGFHDLVAFFATELAPDDTEPVRRLMGWYLSTLYAARVAAYANSALPPVDQPALPAPPHEFAGLADATRWYLRSEPALVEVVRLADRHGWHETAWHLAVLLGDFQSAHAHGTEQLVTAELARRAADAIGDTDKQARAHFLSGVGNNVTGDAVGAVQWHRSALALATDAGNRRLQAAILAAMGTAYEATGDQAAARQTAGRSVEVARELPEVPLRLAHSLVNLASVEVNAGSGELAEAAVVHLLEAVDIYRRHDAAFHLGLALANLADAAVAAGRPAEGLDHAAQALTQVGDLNDGLVRPTALRARGLALVALGDETGARLAWEQALAASFTEPQRAAEIEKDLATLAGASRDSELGAD